MKSRKDSLLSPPSVRSPPQQLKTHSLFFYHKWKHLLIPNSKQFFPYKVYCVLGAGGISLERTISRPVPDKSKGKQYLMLKDAKCAFGVDRCVRKAESREWPDLEWPIHRQRRLIDRGGEIPLSKVSSGQNYPQQTLFQQDPDSWQELNKYLRQ